MNLIPLHNILEYMQIAIIQTEASRKFIFVSFSKLLATTVYTVVPPLKVASLHRRDQASRLHCSRPPQGGALIVHLGPKVFI